LAKERKKNFIKDNNIVIKKKGEEEQEKY